MLERTSHYLKSGVLREKPVWFDVVGANPPSTDLTKKPKKFDFHLQNPDPSNPLFKQNNKSGYFKTRSSVQDRKQTNNGVSRIPKLTFLEDKLRDVFYHQHPWEFSRPKTLVENEGNEWAKCDWSHMLQLYKPLDGESVVQRTLWLLAENKSSEDNREALFTAYDQARFEYYRLRMEEEMSSTVSREESTMFGAVFRLTNMEHGVKQEQEVVDAWTQQAFELTKVRSANKESKKSGSMGSDEAVEEQLSIWEAVQEEL